ncbi:hypothetical protein FVE85_6924 [Porphyridium purpureum]|uniref:Pentatricopeptide repeat-containing protein n=1 Tax=Porphyridium purpureum TaxID=35688 RepID=A0A5J4Z5K7_PORPP|nr:hypothetical protein FVE85_6924 [Porphyridium purpureum]|eukprot:POR6462..scf295_1
MNGLRSRARHEISRRQIVLGASCRQAGYSTEIDEFRARLKKTWQQQRIEGHVQKIASPSQAWHYVPPVPLNPARHNAETKAFNDWLAIAFRDQVNLHELRRTLETSTVPFNEVTVSTVLRIARSVPDGYGQDRVMAARRLVFAVRMLQLARKKHDVTFNAHVLTHVLALAKPCRKVNVVIAVQQLVKQHENNLSAMAYNGMISHFARCGRTQLLRNAFYDAVRELGSTIESATFMRTLRGLLSLKDSDAALSVWKVMRSPPFKELLAFDQPDILESGAWVCACAVDAETDEANWILEQHKKHGIKPTAVVAHLLMTVFIHAGQLEKAREVMQWVIDLGYALHDRECFRYVSACAERKDQTGLLSLSPLLIRAQHLGSTDRERMRFFRRYFSALCEMLHVEEEQKDEDADDNGEFAALVNKAAKCAYKVYTRWQVSDSVATSCIVYLAARAGNPKLALKLADACHRRDLLTDNTLRAFAYRALALVCLETGKVKELLELIFEEASVPSARRLSLNAITFAATSFINALGRADRIDLCKDIYFRVSPSICSVGVSTAYMFELGRAGYPEEAIDIFRDLQMRAKHNPALGPNEITHAALAALVVRHARSEELSKRTVNKILYEMALFTSRKDNYDRQISNLSAQIEPMERCSERVKIEKQLIDLRRRADSKLYLRRTLPRINEHLGFSDFSRFPDVHLDAPETNFQQYRGKSRGDDDDDEEEEEEEYEDDDDEQDDMSWSHQNRMAEKDRRRERNLRERRAREEALTYFRPEERRPRDLQDAVRYFGRAGSEDDEQMTREGKAEMERAKWRVRDTKRTGRDQSMRAKAASPQFADDEDAF